MEYPPEGEVIIRDKLANLERFIHADDDIDPLVKLAVMHYQFEAIHPFSDGKGRTGRIINILYLIERGLLDLPILYLSRYIIDHKSEYYAGLRQVTEAGAWEPWILYILEAVEQMARAAREKIVAIRDLMHDFGEQMKRDAPRIYSKDLVEVIFRQPYCKIRFIEQAGLGHRETASIHLKKLESIGLLRSFKAGREHYYLNDPLLDILRK